MGPAPVVPDPDTELLQFHVMNLRFIICDVRSKELQNLRLSLSQVLHLIENGANAVTWSSSYEGSRACMAQITASVFQVFALSCAPVPQEDEPEEHEELPSHSEHSLQPPQKAVGLCHGPGSASAAPSPLQTAPALAMEAAVQKSHPVPSNVQLIITAGIPHMAAYPSLQSCKQVAGMLRALEMLPQPLLHLAQVGSEHPRAGSSSGWFCREPTNFFSKSVCISSQFHLTKCMSIYQTG